MTPTSVPDKSSSVATPPFARGRWLLDPTHSSVVFSVRHLGLSKVRGRFDHVEAILDLEEQPEDIRVTATIDMSSVNTNNPERDEHLRSTDFFDIAAHPTMEFRSTRITGAGHDWLMEGDLTINGITHRVSLPTVYNGTGLLGNVPHAGFEVAGQLKRSDYGIDFGLVAGVEVLVVSDTVHFELDLQFIEDTEDR